MVRTSGSTGTPKATVLTVDALAASSMATAFALKGEGQWLLALPLQYVAGVQVLVRSLFAGHPALGDGPGRRLHPGGVHRRGAGADGQDPLHLAGARRSCSGCWTRPRPTRWPCCAASTPSCSAARPASAGTPRRRPRRRRAGGDHLRLGRDLRRLRLRRRSAGRRRGPARRGRPASCWAGPPSPPATWTRPSSTAETFIEEDGVRWYRTNDLGELDADGRLTVLGRADDVDHHRRRQGLRRARAGGAGKARRRAGGFCGRRPVRGVGPGRGRLRGRGRTAPRDGDRRASPRRPEACRDRRWAGWRRKPCSPPASCIMLPNGKPDRLGMTVRLDALHQGK